jgi:hypothetical protein
VSSYRQVVRVVGAGARRSIRSTTVAGPGLSPVSAADGTTGASGTPGPNRAAPGRTDRKRANRTPDEKRGIGSIVVDAVPRLASLSDPHFKCDSWIPGTYTGGEDVCRLTTN